MGSGAYQALPTALGVGVGGGVVTGRGPGFDSGTGFLEWEYKLQSSTVNPVYLTNKGGTIIALI
jgi:hypothetical protein